MEEARIRRALISVSDKTGLEAFCRRLHGHGVALLSTGGTAAAIAAAGLPVAEVSDIVDFPEMLEGRVKTLHPAIHGGILARRDRPAHLEALAQNGIDAIDLVAVDLYPFEKAVAAGVAWEQAVETVDVGGVAMIRAAAKNHADVAILVDAEDRAPLLAEMDAGGGATSLALRRRLAAVAFARTAAYDAAIARRFACEAGAGLARRAVFAGGPGRPLRYGENPHQRAAFYADGSARPGAATARQLGGKALSFNNLADADAAFELVAEFERPAAAIVKHANPCGVALGDDLAAAHARALACDPVSAFGGVVAVNRRLDEAAARAIAGVFTEVVIAPDADEAARAVLAERKGLRLLLAGAVAPPAAPGLQVRSLAGGLLVQDRDAGTIAAADLRAVTARCPSAAETADMLFAFRVAKHARSNAVVYARGGATLAIGAGQTSRIDSAVAARHKAERAGLSLAGCVVASDAFFPFADGLLAAAAAGATAAIQPGGSRRDPEVIAAADEKGMAMVFTGRRHFRH